MVLGELTGRGRAGALVECEGAVDAGALRTAAASAPCGRLSLHSPIAGRGLEFPPSEPREVCQ